MNIEDITPKKNSRDIEVLIEKLNIPPDEIIRAEEFNAIVNEVKDLKLNKEVSAFNFKENVPTYADLPLVGNEVNDGYGVIEDGLVYVWNGEAFQPEGEGMDLGLRPSGIVEEDNELAVSGAKVFEKYNPFFKFSNLLPFTLAKGELSQATGIPNSSENWLRTGNISCKPLTTYSISGLGIGISALSAKRIMLYADGALLDIITQNPVEKKITFTTPEGCDFF